MPPPPAPSQPAPTPPGGPSTPSCRYYNVGAGCVRGPACRFQHAAATPAAPRPAADPGRAITAALGPSTSRSVAGQTSTNAPPEPCIYFASPSGCTRGSKCRFSHTLSSAPDNCAGSTSAPRPAMLAGSSTAHPPARAGPQKLRKPCKYFQTGYCARDDMCWYTHDLSNAPSCFVADMAAAAAHGTAASSSVEHGQAQAHGPERPACSICYESPSTYGLLSGCDHIFCLPCLKKWRACPRPGMNTGTFDDEDAANRKLCPVCRTVSLFVIPSSFFVTGANKATAVHQFRASTRKKACKYFEASKKSRAGLFCPFADDCFYSHALENNQFEFGMTAQEMLNVRVRRRLLPERRQEGLRALGLGDSSYAGDYLISSSRGRGGQQPQEDPLAPTNLFDLDYGSEEDDTDEDDLDLIGFTEDNGRDLALFMDLVTDFEELDLVSSDDGDEFNDLWDEDYPY